MPLRDMDALHDALTVDPEFEALCPPLADAELAQLKSNLEADSCRDPLVVWGCNGDDLILDGHNRYRLCAELGIGFKTKRLSFADRDEAKRWIITNQLGRRNLSDEQRTLLMGRLFKATKGSRGGDRKSNHRNDGLKPAAEAIAEQFAVSVPTVERAAKFAEGFDKVVEALGKDAGNEILAGKSDLTKSDVAKIASCETKTEVKAAIKAAKEPKPEPTHPRSDSFFAWLQQVGGKVNGIEIQYGSMAGMMKSSEWDKKRNGVIRPLLYALRDDLDRMIKEFDDACG